MAYIADSFKPNTSEGAEHPTVVRTASADGAITIAAGVVKITKGTAAALTIDNPPLEMEGAELTIISKTAAAHTVDYTPGFGGGTTSRDRATFGGAIDDNIVLLALDGVWHTKSTRNVSLG